MTLLTGLKVIVRDKTVADAKEDYLWRADTELSRLDNAKPLSISFADFQAYNNEELKYPTPRRKRLSIDTLDGQHIGNCMYYDIDFMLGQTEIGIMIGDRDFWNKGYGAETISLLVDHIFSDSRMQRVYLHTLDWNIRAQKSFEKCGFVPTKTVQRQGSNLARMELLRDSREARKHSSSQ